MADGMKRCSKCAESKSLNAFSRCASKRDGLQVWCKQCCKQKNSDWQKENRASINERARRDRVRNAVRLREKAREKYQRTKAACNDRSRSYYQRNRDKVLQQTKAYQLAHKDEHAESNRKYRIGDRAKKLARERAARNLSMMKDSVIRSGYLGLRKADCPPELIELKRQQLTIHRLLKQMKKAIEEGESK